MAATASSLPMTTRLGEFELTGVLGEGGFSVVYAAQDHSLDRTVAIKEYMPSAIAARMSDGSVAPKSPRHEETFRAGLESFLNEARLLARFSHPALIHVHRIWEQNGTAYMAMQYCVGQTLRQISQSEPETVRHEGWLKVTFSPILDALELLHAENCFHRDISPDNILVLQSGEPMLLDFGAARRVIGDMTQALTVILKPGFAPIEQYADDASLQQGPWTDVYGVGAALYYLLMGKPPVASVARLIKDPIVKLASADALVGISLPFRRAIDRALAVYPNQRIASIADLREALQLPAFKSADAPADRAASSSSPTVPNAASGETQTPEYANTLPNELADNDADDDTSLADFRATDSSGFEYSMIAEEKNPVPDTVAMSARQFIERHAALAGAGLLFVVVAVCAAIVFISLHRPSRSSSPDAYLNDNNQAATQNAPAALPADQPASPAPDASQSAVASAPFMADTASVAASQATPAQNATTNTTPTINAFPEDRGPAPVIVPPPPLKTLPEPSQHTAAAISDAKAPATHTSAAAASTNFPPTDAFRATSSAEAAKVTPPQIETSSRARPAAQQPAAASAANAMPTIRLSIQPWGDVTIDGQPVGTSPPLTRLPLTPGKHEVVIINSSFPRVVQNIVVPEKGEVVVSQQFGTE